MIFYGRFVCASTRVYPREDERNPRVGITIRLESRRLNYLSVVSRTNRPCVRRGARTLNRRSMMVEPNGRAASSRTPRATRRRLDRDERPSEREVSVVRRVASARGFASMDARRRGPRAPRRRRLIVAAGERVGGDARARRWRVASVDRTRFFIVGIVARGFTVGARRASRARGDTDGDWMMTDAIVAVTGAVRRGFVTGVE